MNFLNSLLEFIVKSNFIIVTPVHSADVALNIPPHNPIDYSKQPAEVWVLFLPFYKWWKTEAHIG